MANFQKILLTGSILFKGKQFLKHGVTPLRSISTKNILQLIFDSAHETITDIIPFKLSGH